MSSEIIYRWDMIIYHVADVLAGAMRGFGFSIGVGIALNGLFRMLGGRK